MIVLKYDVFYEKPEVHNTGLLHYSITRGILILMRVLLQNSLNCIIDLFLRIA